MPPFMNEEILDGIGDVNSDECCRKIALDWIGLELGLPWLGMDWILACMHL